MAIPRRQPTLKCRLAAALCALTDGAGNRLIPHEHAKLMSEDQVISLFQFNHYPIRHEAGGPAEHWNLDPELIMVHRKITATRDAPEIAKIRDVATSEAIHAAALASKAGDYKRSAEILASVPKKSRLKPKQKIPGRPFPKGRGFEKRRMGE